MTGPVLTAADDGREIALKAGDQAELRLKENPTTGFRWQPTPAGTNVVGVGSPRFAPSGSAPGAGGFRVFTLAALRPGRAVLALELRRPGQGGVPPRARFVVTVIVG